MQRSNHMTPQTATRTTAPAAPGVPSMRIKRIGERLDKDMPLAVAL